MFYTDADRNRFLDLLGATVDQFHWILMAYVLMSNHYHFVIELTASNFSKGIKWLNQKYAQYFNRAHERVGHLMQGRPDARLIDKETYMLRVLRYNVLNPVRAHIVRSPADYDWSSYRATAGLAPSPSWLAVDEVLKFFGRERKAAQREYRQFVHAGITDNPWEDIEGDIYLGEEEWLEEMRDKVQVKLRDSEHPRAQRHVVELTMTDVIDSVSLGLNTNADWLRTGHGGNGRMLAAWLGKYNAELTLSQIAAGLRIRSASQASRLIARCDRLMTDDANLQLALDRCLNALHER